MMVMMIMINIETQLPIKTEILQKPIGVAGPILIIIKLTNTLDRQTSMGANAPTLPATLMLSWLINRWAVEQQTDPT